MLDNDGLPPTELSPRDDAPSLPMTLLFAGTLAAAIPAAIAFLFHGVAPTVVPAFVLGDVFGVAGTVGAIFAERTMLRVARDKTLTINDRRMLMRDAVAKRIACSGAMLAGLAVMVIVFMPAMLSSRHGAREAANITGLVMGALTLFTMIFAGRQLYRCDWRDQAELREDRPIGGAKLSFLLFATLAAFFAPVAACALLARSMLT